MANELQVTPDIHGCRLNLAWTWLSAEQSRPDLEVIRRQRAYPLGPDDGLRLFRLHDVLEDAGRHSARLERAAYLNQNDPVESGVFQAEIRLGFETPEAQNPNLAVFAGYDAELGQIVETKVSNPSRCERVSGPAAPWRSKETLTVYSPRDREQPAIEIAAYFDHADGVTPNRLEWRTALAASTKRVEFERVETGQVVVLLEEIFDPDTGLWRRRLTAYDDGLQPETVYYYQLFRRDDPAGAYHTEPAWRGCGMATGPYGLGQRLYQLLPAHYQQFDEPTPQDRDNGPLRRFLQVGGAALDQLRSQAEGLRARHDVLNAPAQALPHLAQWIGWELDQTLDILAQRNEILFAPEIYQTIGTIPNIKALVNRATNWDCRVKEFVHNVCLSNAPEPIHLWEVWERRHTGSDWASDEPLTTTDGFDGRPTGVVDAQGQTWLYWHSDRSGRRELWRQNLHDHGAVAEPMLADVTHTAGDIDENPAVVNFGGDRWIFWDSNRGGRWDIWGRRYRDQVGAEPLNLTRHSGEDRYPAAVVDQANRLWLFWQSNRRVPTDIWAMMYDGQEWSTPVRITTAEERHETPAAIVDAAGRIWLFYCAHDGSSRKICCQIHDQTGWQSPRFLTAGPCDEAPAACWRDGQIWLFWHGRDQSDCWQIWCNTFDGQQWQKSSPVTTDPAADKEPGVVVDADGQLRVFWRSQRRGRRYQSRTLDFGDTEMIARLGTFADRAHYTYDTGTTDNDWYARGTIGLYLTPDTPDAELQSQNRQWVASLARQFLPINVRAVVIIEAPSVDQEHVYTYDFPEVVPQRLIGEQCVEPIAESVTAEPYSGLVDTRRDIVPGWTWIRTWSVEYRTHRTVDFTADPIDTHLRTWHIGLEAGG